MATGPSAAAANAALSAILDLMDTVRVHTGDPGIAGDDNRVGSAVDLTAATWDTPDVATDTSPTYGADLNFGVLSTTDEETVTNWSGYDSGGNFTWSGQTTSTAVDANASAIMNSGTLGIRWDTSLASD